MAAVESGNDRPDINWTAPAVSDPSILKKSTRTVLVAYGHNLVRRGLRSLLDAHPRLAIVAEASTGREAIEAAQRTHPDMAIVDYSLPELNGLDLTIELRRMATPVEVLIYSAHEREDLVVDAVRVGAKGFVAKSDSEQNLLDAIEAVSRHRPYFSSSISRSLRERLESAPSSPGFSLTHREREVVQLIAEGRINKEVAQILNISIKTVETHRASAMQKLDLRTSAELVRYAIRNGMIEA